MGRKKPVHFVPDIVSAFTACGIAGKFRPILCNLDGTTKGTTCKLCRKTETFKSYKKAEK